jgi:hypothetical protein
LLTWPKLDEYVFALVFNDPNGPGGHGDQILGHLARAIRRAGYRFSG